MTWQMIFAPLGIGFLILLSYWLGDTKRAQLASPEAARDCFAQDFPASRVSDVTLSANGHHALLLMDDGSIGIVFAVGNQFATRLWKEGAAWGFQRDPRRLLFSPYDDSMRPIVVTLKNEQQADEWEARLIAVLDAPEYKTDKTILKHS